MRRRLEQVLVTLLATLSLVVTSVPACACHHHPEETNLKRPACHDDAEMSDMADDQTVATYETTCFDSDCVCIMTADRGVVKSEALKLKKATATVTVETETIASFAVTVNDEPQLVFEKPSYLTDSFYNLAPKRGPPIL